MNPDDRLAQIREHRQTLPDSRAGTEISRRGLQGEALGAIRQLESAVCAVAVAFEGDLDEVQPEHVTWLSYIAEKAEYAEKAAKSVRDLFDFAGAAPAGDS